MEGGIYLRIVENNKVNKMVLVEQGCVYFWTLTKAGQTLDMASCWVHSQKVPLTTNMFT